MISANFSQLCECLIKVNNAEYNLLFVPLMRKVQENKKLMKFTVSPYWLHFLYLAEIKSLWIYLLLSFQKWTTMDTQVREADTVLQKKEIFVNQWTLWTMKGSETQLVSTAILLPSTDKAFQITTGSETLSI